MQAYDTDASQSTDTGIDPLDLLEYSDKAAKRATHEALELTPLGDGRIEVVNASHGDDAHDEHTYTVHVERGIPFDCTCPAAEFHSGACKHQIRCAVSPAVLEAAGEQDLRTDGGATAIDADAPDEPAYTYHVEPPEQGGARYVRCETCGAEVIPADPDRLVHRAECPHREVRR